MPSDIPQSVLGKEFLSPCREITVAVDCVHRGKMLHEGRRGKFVFHSDEPPAMGGDDNHPAPLTYIAAGVGF